MPYHWPECNALTSSKLDPLSKIPGFKYTPVRIEAVTHEIDLRDLEAPEIESRLS